MEIINYASVIQDFEMRRKLDPMVSIDEVNSYFDGKREIFYHEVPNLGKTFENEFITKIQESRGNKDVG